MKLAIVVLAMSAFLIAPAAAAADTGSITVTGNRYAASPGWAYVSFTVTATKTTCDGTGGYCGWFPYVTRMDHAEVCSPDGSVTYVGELLDGLGTETGTEVDDLMDGTPVRLCLYVSSAGQDHFIADTVVDLAGQAATPPPPPYVPPTPVAPKQKAKVQRLTIGEARSSLRSVLRHKLGTRFTTRRSHYHRSCSRFTHAKVRCRVRWDFAKKLRYSGTVTMRADPSDAGSLLYTTSIRHRRLHVAKPKPKSQPAPSCDPNYSGCLDPNAYDYDCLGGAGDGPRYTGEVRIYGDDHFDLDRDGDGIGCDT